MEGLFKQIVNDLVSVSAFTTRQTKFQNYLKISKLSFFRKLFKLR